jgi:hypothetical protein
LRLLAWHAPHLDYSDHKPSNRPADVHLVPPTYERRHYSNCLAVFTTIEAGDDDLTVATASKDIIELATMVRPTGGIVVVPFAHLSHALAKAKVARELLTAFASRLASTADFDVDLASFGFHKSVSFVMEVGSHPGAVAFRHYEKRGAAD